MQARCASAPKPSGFRTLAMRCPAVLCLLVSGCAAEEPEARARYTTGHADLLMALGPDASAGMQVFLAAGGAVIDGERKTNRRYALTAVEIVSSAVFERPEKDKDAFALLCADPGESVRWLPQNLQDASRREAPFLGLSVKAPSGLLVDDQLRLRLVSVTPDSDTGHYALWRDGLRPEFHMSTCDGIDAEDELPLPIGHDHFNMAFSAPGQWSVRYGVSAATPEGGMIESEFSVNYTLLK